MSEEIYAAESVTEITPGTVLRKGREARSLSIEEVARALRLSTKQIAAIEAGKLETLGGEVFVRGFIRNYARFVHIDPEFVLELLGAQPAPATPLVKPVQSRVVMPSAGDGKFKFSPAIAILVLALGLGGGAGFYLGWFDAARITALFDSGQAQTPDAAPRAVIQQPANAVKTLPPAEKFPEKMGASGNIEQQHAPTVAAQPNPGGESPRLVLRFRQEAWAEVRDANNRLLLSQKNSAGSTQIVAGKPPFKMIIGNAAAVELEYDGRSIDLQPHTRVDVARLTLE